MKHIITTLALVVAALSVGCDDDHPRQGNTVTTEIVAQQYLMNAEELDTALIMGRLKATGGVPDAPSLEAWINTTPGVNAVDIDKNGKRDPISVVEEREGGPPVLALRAMPQTGDPVVVLEMQFKKVGTETIVSAGHPPYVQGSQHHHYTASLGDVLFAQWLWNASRPVYFHPPGFYGGMGWAQPVPVMRGSSLRETRRTTRTTTKVAPIKRQKKPDTFKSRSSGAKKVAAKRQAKSKSATLSATAGKGKNFQKRDPNKARAKASNATRGGAKKSAAASRPSRSKRPSRPKSSSSRSRSTRSKR